MEYIQFVYARSKGSTIILWLEAPKWIIFEEIHRPLKNHNKWGTWPIRLLNVYDSFPISLGILPLTYFYIHQIPFTNYVLNSFTHGIQTMLSLLFSFFSFLEITMLNSHARMMRLIRIFFLWIERFCSG
jgi:hypothetical protein